MASAYSQPISYTPYQDRFNKELLLEALQYRQEKYDVNREKIKSQLSDFMNYDLAKEEDVEYLANRTQTVVNAINSVGNIDLSLESVADQVQAYTSRIADDKIINGYTGTLALRDFQDQVEKSREDGTYADRNYAYSSQDLNRWLNDGQAGSAFKGNSQYTPFTDVDALLREAMGSIEGDTYVNMTPMGNYTFLKTKGVEVPAEKIRASFSNIIASNPNAAQQLVINAWSQFQDMDDETFAAYNQERTQEAINMLDESMASLARAALTAQDPEESALYEELMDQYRDQKNSFQANSKNFNRTALEQFYYNEDLLQGYVTEFATNRVTDMSFETNQGDLQMALKSMDIQADLLKSKYEASYDYMEEFLNPSKPQTAEYREVLYNLSKPALIEQNLIPETEEGLEMTVEEFDAIQASSRSLLEAQEFKPEKVVVSDFTARIKQLDSELDGYLDQYTILAEAHYANDPNKLALFNKGFLGSRALLITALQKGKDPLSQDPTFMGDQQLNTIRQRSMQTAAELGTMQAVDNDVKAEVVSELGDFFASLKPLDKQKPLRNFFTGPSDYVIIEDKKYVWNSAYQAFERPVKSNPTLIERGIDFIADVMYGPPIPSENDLYSLESVKEEALQVAQEGGNVSAKIGRFSPKLFAGKKTISSYNTYTKELGDALLSQSELYMTPTITAESAGGKEIIREAYQAAAQTGQLTDNVFKRLIAVEDGVIPEDLTYSSLGFNLLGGNPKVIILEGGLNVGELFFSDIPTGTSLEFVARDAYDAVQMKQTYDWYDGYLEPGETIPAIVSNPISLAGSDGKMYTQRTKVEVKKGNSSNQYYVQLVNTVHDEQGQVYKQPSPGSYGSFTEILFDGMAFPDPQTAMNAAAQINPEFVQSYVTPVISE